MRTYFSQIFDSMNAEKGFKYKGVEKEVAAHFVVEKSSKDLPITVECFGITFEDKNYEIFRSNQNRYVIEYVLSGEGTIEIENKTFNVKAGDAYILEANTTQHYYSNKNNPFKKYWINFKSDIFAELLSLFNIKGLNYFPNCNLEELFLTLFQVEQISSFSNDISYAAMSIVFQMLLKIKENMSLSDKYVPDIIKKAKTLIDETLESKTTINEICEQLYISKPTLISNFKEYYGVTPHVYKSKKRLQVACTYLKYSPLDIESIASNLGFSDIYTFSHWFKKEKGISPLQYRKKYIKK